MHNDAVWLKWIRAHFMDEADYAAFCWVTDNIIACYA